MTQSGSGSTAGVREGDIIAGKYRVERVLGIGGMGVVVAAHHIQLDERVALKFLLPEALGNAESAARFAREARAAVKIKSEHVARVTDVGTLPNGAPHMVMEYLEGSDLAGWIKQQGGLPIEQAVEFVLQACVAVADAHALGIVHRDLKPANLFCVRRSDGQLSIKVLDFGISKMTDLAGTGPGIAMTRMSALMGSPLYMSPEQMRSSKDVDAMTDIWALGVILFELITGRQAFLADTVTELAIKIASEQTPLIRTFRPDVPADLDAIVSKCLQKDKRRRFRNVAELALALLPFAPKRAKGSVERISGIIQSAGLSTSALAVPLSPPIDATQASAGTLPPLGRTTTGASRSKKFAGAAVGTITLLAVVGTVVLLRRGGAEYKDDSHSQASGPSTSGAALLPPVTTPQVPRAAPAVEPPKSVEAKPVEVPAPAVTYTQPTPDTVQVAEAGMKKKARPNNVAAPPASSATALAPAPAPTARAAAPAAIRCDPPFYFDANGRRIFKTECL